MKKKDVTIVDVLKVIKTFEGIPTLRAIANVLSIDTKVLVRLEKESQSIFAAINARRKEYIEGLNDDEFLSVFTRSSKKLPDTLQIILEDRLNKILLSTVEHFSGIPTISGIAKKLGISQASVWGRVQSSSDLQKAIAKQSDIYVAELSDKELIKKFSDNSWVSTLPQSAKVIADLRLDSILLSTINDFDGVPTVSDIADSSKISYDTANRRISANRSLRIAMEQRARQYIMSLNDDTFLQYYLKPHGKVPEYIREVLDQRMCKVLISVITNFEGFLTANNLEEVIPVSHNTIRRKISQNAGIRQAFRKKRLDFLKTANDNEILSRLTTPPFYDTLSKTEKKIADVRLGGIIIAEIDSFEGVPTNYVLSKKLGMSPKTLSVHIHNSPRLSSAMKAQGITYLENLNDTELISIVSQSKLMTAPHYAKAIIEKRITTIILNAIETFPGEPDYLHLSNSIGLSRHTLQQKVQADATLWNAYQNKLGLTPDQAVELALERGEEHEAAKSTLARRLRNLHAYREMVGVIRVFGDLLKGNICEFSLYPNPLGKTSEELGANLRVSHLSMQAFRQGEKIALGSFDAVVIQSMHRLETEATNKLMAEIFNAVGSGKPIIITYSVLYAPPEGFFEALETKGFETKEHGVLQISPPDRETLLSYGVEPADVARISKKITGESHVIILQTKEKQNDAQIPRLQKIPEGEGSIVSNGPNAIQIDTPRGLAREIRANFLGEMNIPVISAQPYIIEITYDERIVAIAGFDMNPRKRNSIEVGVYQGAPALDYRKIAREIATNIAERNRLGVKQNQISRVPLQKLAH